MYTIYRYENCNGEGPYVSYKNFQVAEQAALDDRLSTHLTPEHPVPYSEVLPGLLEMPEFVSGEHQCAFPTIEAIFRWFDVDERRLLSACGFMLKKYTVSHRVVSRSGKQCCYEPKDVIEVTVLFN